MAKKVCPKCKGKGCSHCGGTGYHKTGMAKGGDMGKKPMTKKEQKKAGIRGATKQYDVGYRDTPNSEAVLTAGKKKKAKEALNDISNALNMSAGGDVGKKKPMNAGMAALKKKAPKVAAKMGYMYGGMAKKGFKHGGLACGADVPAKNPVKRGKA